MMDTTISLLDDAIQLLTEGFGVLPCHAKDKHPNYKWKEYQKNLPSEQQLKYFFGKENYNAIFFITGEVSGNLEFIDFDNKGQLFEAWKEIINNSNGWLFDKLVIESTQSGGVHVAYRCESKIEGNLKLATINNKTLIETRGEGGLVLVAPSEGYKLIQNEYAKIATITTDERLLLLNSARLLSDKIEVKKEVFNEISKGGAICSFDDYNQRGDLGEVLLKHGWIFNGLINGEKTYTRPGKASGVSATLRGAILYVFSSNAYPFQNKGYSRSDAFCLLECQGEKTICNNLLLQMGYGEKLSNVDIPSIMHNFEIRNSDKIYDDSHEVVERENKKNIGSENIPKRLLDVGGFIGQVVEHAMLTAPCQNLVMSFCGALALNSILIGRKVKGFVNVRPNLFLLGLSMSGTGKEHPRYLNKKILDAVGMGDIVGNKVASWQGLEDIMYAKKKMLYQTDEISGFIDSINKDFDGSKAMLMSTFLEMQTSSGGSYNLRNKSGEAEIRTIDQPYLTMFGTCTAKEYYKSLSEKMLNNGFFGRMLVFEAYKREEPSDNFDFPLPAQVLTTAKFWAKPSNQGNLGDNFYCNPIQIDNDPEAKKRIAEFRLYLYNSTKKFEDNENNAGMTIWNRAAETAQKLALNFACSDNPTKPYITLKNVEHAIELASYLVQRMVFKVDGKSKSIDPILINADKIKAELKLRKKKGIALVELRKIIQISSESFSKAIKELFLNEEIYEEKQSIKSSQKKSTIYFIKDI